MDQLKDLIKEKVVAILKEAAKPDFPDVDGDGEVGFLDLIAVLTDWGSCPGCSADTDGNGSVDNGDLIRVLAAWGGC